LKLTNKELPSNFDSNFNLRRYIVWVNCSQPCFPQLPWGGKKRSGFGRDLGEDGMDKYMHVKQLVRYMSKVRSCRLTP